MDSSSRIWTRSRQRSSRSATRWPVRKARLSLTTCVSNAYLPTCPNHKYVLATTTTTTIKSIVKISNDGWLWFQIKMILDSTWRIVAQTGLVQRATGIHRKSITFNIYVPKHRLVLVRVPLNVWICLLIEGYTLGGWRIRFRRCGDSC